jgi:hypothetical protein
MNVCRLDKTAGKRTFYIKNASSQALQKENLGIFDIFKVKGESVRFDFKADEKNAETLAQEICQVYQAEIVKIERVYGAVSYYAYSPKLGGGVAVDGKKVNLHIAVGETQAAVGTPLIFGGF